MSAAIQQPRTMQRPGQGIVNPAGPTAVHSEYPKHMAHPGYQPGSVGDEVKSPHGFSYHVGGTSIRFPPVLVHDEDQEEYHKSQGYVSIGKSDPAAFARAVASAAPTAEIHEPDPYPKWIAALNRSVGSAEEEAEALGLSNEGAPRTLLAPEMPSTSSEEPGAEPALSAEVNTLEVWPDKPSADTARIDALESKVDTIVGSFDKLSGLLSKVLAGQIPAAEPEPPPVASEVKPPAPVKAKVTPQRSADSIARSERIKAGLAKKKAALAATTTEPVVTETAQAVD